jgi:hypothetical protein
MTEQALSGRALSGRTIIMLGAAGGLGPEYPPFRRLHRGRLAQRAAPAGRWRPSSPDRALAGGIMRALPGDRVLVRERRAAEVSPRISHSARPVS